MRLSPRTDSPEVLRVSDSSPSSAESSFRELDDVFLQTQTRIWLGEVLHMRFDEETAIADLLADGELLFQVSKVVSKMLQTNCVGTKYSKVYVNEPASPGKSGGRYMPYSNVDSFFKLCKILGLTGIDLFSPSDVVEKRDTRRVCMCIRALSKKARSKHLNIPDFDVVTYTIAMPTDMVGYIRRSLEKSQSSSSTFVVCSRCMHSKGKYKQKIREVDYIRKFYLSSEESDDAESSIQVLEFQSPASDASYDAITLSGVFRENSPGRDSVVEENFSTPENRFRLGVQDQHNDGMRTNQYGEVCLVESGESPSSRFMTFGNCRFPTEDTIMSTLPHRECQIDPKATTSCTRWRWVPENGREMYDVDLDLCRTASFVRDLPKELDGLFHVNSKETFSSELCCNESMLCDDNLRSCLFKLMPSDSSVSSDVMQEEFTNVSVVPSDAKQIVSHVTNGGHTAEPKMEDSEVSTPMLNPILCKEATLTSKKGDLTGSNAHFHQSQNPGEIQQSNTILEGSASDEFNIGKLSPRFSDVGSNIASKYVYWNQLDEILTGQLDSLCNGFTHNKIYNSSVGTNGNSGNGVSAKCMPSHDSCPTHICPRVNSKDTEVLFDVNSTDKRDASAAVSEPDVTVTKQLNDPSLSIVCFVNTEIAHEEETMSLEKESCHTFEMCKVMQGAVKPLCSEVFTQNKVNDFSENRQENILLETKVSKKSSTGSEEDRSVKSASVGESDIPHAKPLGSVRVSHGESVSEPKGARTIHSFISLSNDLPPGKRINLIPISTNFSDNEEKQRADVSTSENKPLPAIDCNGGSTISESTSRIERQRLEIDGREFPVDFNKACLDIPNISNVDPEVPNKVTDDHTCASGLVFANNLVPHNRFSCMDSLGFDCASVQILGSEPCLIPACLESSRDINQHNGMDNDDSKNLINEKEPEVPGDSMNLKDADSARNKEETGKNQLDSRTGYSSGGRDSNKVTGVKNKRHKKLLLKSVAGGMTLFGALFLLLHLRRGEEKIGPRGIRGSTALSKTRKLNQDGLQTGKAVGVYPGERLKLQD